MSKHRPENKVLITDSEQPKKVVAESVSAKSYDPADFSNNHNADLPIYATPKAVPHSFNPMAGGENLEGAGESRPMFGSSFKE